MSEVKTIEVNENNYGQPGAGTSGGLRQGFSAPSCDQCRVDAIDLSGMIITRDYFVYIYQNKFFVGH